MFRAAIDSFVDLVSRNSSRIVSLHYLTTSPLGTERSAEDRIGDEGARAYWRRAAAGAEVGPLRALLDRMDLAPRSKSYLAAMFDEEFGTDFLARIHWHCGAPGLQDVRADLVARLVEYVSTNRGLRKAWSGGSVRRLHRLAETILQNRETWSSRH